MDSATASVWSASRHKNPLPFDSRLWVTPFGSESQTFITGIVGFNMP